MTTLGHLKTILWKSQSDKSGRRGIATAQVEVASSKSLRRKVTWTLVGGVFYAAFQLAVLSVLAQMGTLELVGRIELALALTAPIVMALDFGLRVTS